MRRLLAFTVAIVAFGFGAYRALGAKDADAAQPAAESAGVQGEFETILRADGNGRYSKHGWNHYGPGYFTLDPQTGVLTSHGGMGLLWYAKKEYRNFVLELEFKVTDAESNAGIFLRVPGIPTSDDYIYHSFEIQIWDGGDGIHQTAAAYDAEAPTARASRPIGEWNAYQITFDGDRLTVVLNGQQVVDWQAEPRGKVADFAPRGYLGIQNHDPNSVYFRNIRVKELP